MKIMSLVNAVTMWPKPAKAIINGATRINAQTMLDEPQEKERILKLISWPRRPALNLRTWRASNDWKRRSSLVPYCLCVCVCVCVLGAGDDDSLRRLNRRYTLWRTKSGLAVWAGITRRHSDQSICHDSLPCHPQNTILRQLAPVSATQLPPAHPNRDPRRP